MAVFAHVPVALGVVVKRTITAAASSTDIVIGTNQIFSIVATGDCNVRFGNATTIGNAAATDSFIASKVKEVFDMGNENDRIRVFNPAGTIDVYISNLGKQS